MSCAVKIRFSNAAWTLCLLASLLLLGALASPVGAQIPDEFTSLKVLDPAIEKPELIDTMRGWTQELGVRCNHCHVGPDNLQGMDFASDEKATKRTARRMLEMSQKINGELLADLPVAEEGEDHQAVSCYTCHRGQATPPRNLVDVLAEVAKESGPEAAIDEYRAMREEHESAGRYDFREESLSRLSRRHAESGDFDGALAVLDGAKEFFGDSPSVYTNEGMIKFSQGDLEGARASFTQAVEIDPDFGWAKQSMARLEEMTKRSAPPVDSGEE
jgi:hypothetical protein